MTQNLLNSLGKIIKNSWKYLPIGWTIHDFTRENLDLENPWQYFKFGMRNAISLGVILTLSLAIYKCTSDNNTKPMKDIHQENKSKILSNIYYYKN